MTRRLLGPVLALALASCTGARQQYPTTGGALQLSRVVLYRNGVGYFERGGHVDGDSLTIRVRKDQVNDLLKSLTVVEQAGGRAVSISMPLDPRAWANAAISTLGPGAGSLNEVLDKLRGTDVTLDTSDGTISGRILIVEALPGVPPHQPGDTPARPDYKVTLIHDAKLAVVLLSEVTKITLHNGDIAMQFQRSLDATAGEGMFQQVDVTIRLAGKHAHDLAVSYVVGAPMWKPTYRVVLPDNTDGKSDGKALLQGWAVVDNTTGEDWRDVKLSLTSGSPIAFRYDLHTPRDVVRTDVSDVGASRHAEVSVGEAGYGQAADATAAAPPAAAPVTVSTEEDEPAPDAGDDEVSDKKEAKKDSWGAGHASRAPANGAPPPPPKAPSAKSISSQAEQPSFDREALQRSMQARTRAAAVSGLSRYDLDEPMTVPDGTSTMVAIINQQVDGQETFLYKPGGAGAGYEANPYRVVRFKNSTPFALESGPISIYSGGSFVGEGISEPVSAGVAVTIPFAVESSLLVAQATNYDADDVRLVKIVRGVIEIETYSRRTTTWTVTSQLPRDKPITVYVRHPKAGGTYELAPRPKDTEDLPDAYLIPVTVPAGTTGKLAVVEQTPSRSSLSVWDGRMLPLFEGILANNIDADTRAKLEPIVKLRQDIGHIDTEIEGKTRTRAELDQRANETRRNLDAIKKDPAATALRKRLSDRLEQFAKDGDKLGRDLVELQTKRTEQAVALEDALQGLDLEPKDPLAPKKTAKP
jgi:hypothetical protein|nr:hypothetical protein [Kofleriaceae bacterium]